jgi:hypothetical protein
MEDLAVEVVALAVIAQIEPQHVEPICDQLGAERDNVAGLSAAFPAVQNQRNPTLCRVNSDLFRHAIFPSQTQESPQADTLAAIEQPFLRVPKERQASSAGEPLHEWQVTDHRLHLTVAQSARRREFPMLLQGKACRQWSPPRSGAATDSTCIDVGAWSNRFMIFRRIHSLRTLEV